MSTNKNEKEATKKPDKNRVDVEKLKKLKAKKEKAIKDDEIVFKDEK